MLEDPQVQIVIGIEGYPPDLLRQLYQYRLRIKNDFHYLLILVALHTIVKKREKSPLSTPCHHLLIAADRNLLRAARRQALELITAVAQPLLQRHPLETCLIKKVVYRCLHEIQPEQTVI
jgi:hypothetical protein